jgi:hypothetical protein
MPRRTFRSVILLNAATNRMPSGELHEIDDVLHAAFARRWSEFTLEQERHRNFQHGADLLQPARADSVCALFIFLDLLDRQSECFAERDPADLPFAPPHANALADVSVNRVRRFWRHWQRSIINAASLQFPGDRAMTFRSL